MPDPKQGLPEGALAELELQRHFDGKRQGLRTPLRYPVSLRGRKRQVRARTVDISRVGVLVELIETKKGPQSLTAFAEAIEGRFGKGLRIEFDDKNVVVRASPVRVAQSEQAGAWLLACRFSKPLTDTQCGILGIPTDAA